jgi:hypothetical protein
VELAHLDIISKSFGALTSGGVLPLEEAAVLEAFSTFLQPNNESPIAGWRDFAMRSGGADPASAVFKFERVWNDRGQWTDKDGGYVGTCFTSMRQHSSWRHFWPQFRTSSNAWIPLQFGHCCRILVRSGAWMGARRASPITPSSPARTPQVNRVKCRTRL